MIDAKSEAERRWVIHPGGVTDTRDIPDLLRHRAVFIQGAEWVQKHPEYASVPRSVLKYVVAALEGSADNGDRYAAHQIRTALGEDPDDLWRVSLYDAEGNVRPTDEILMEAARKRMMLQERGLID